jgi:prepilin-type N-terminal cleavage/methylation domain-containing protein
MQTSKAKSEKVGCASHTGPRIASLHAGEELSRRQATARAGSRTDDTANSRPDVSTALRFARHDKPGGAGFTLIELLVVISLIALLMAILMPTLGRVRRQARAVVCQSNLRQWGILWATYVAENHGRLPGGGLVRDPDSDEFWPGWWGAGWWGSWQGGPEPGDAQRYAAIKDILCCPMATRPAEPTTETGGTFIAWGGWGSDYPPLLRGCGSYGANGWVQRWDFHPNGMVRQWGWSTPDVREAPRVPVILDSCWPWDGWLYDPSLPPPESDAIPVRLPPCNYNFNSFCINRHDGCANGLFLDWSARKVGLKELWTLKWLRDSNTGGPWTKAGGVQPDQWPKWMRSFKDY